MGKTRECLLYDGKICDGCGECDRCDLDPNKICDNCMKCLNTGADYNAIEVDEIIGDGTITRETADLALHRLEVDALGLDNIDRRMLTAIIQNYGGGPVGLETLAATIGEEAVTLEDVYEPYLMQLGFLTRTPRGRCVTNLAYEHLHIPYDGQQQFSI